MTKRFDVTATITYRGEVEADSIEEAEELVDIGQLSLDETIIEVYE